MSDDFDIRRFEIIPLLDDIKINEKVSIQITCIEVDNHDVYLGTIDSFILFYPKLLSLKTCPTLLTANPLYKYLGLKKSISKLKVLAVLNRLLCHCDNTLIMSNLENLEMISNFRIRNVFAYCLNENPITMDPFQVEICMAKRKSFTIGLLHSDKMNIMKEINVSEQPLLMAMDGHFICMASASNYFMINWETGSSQLLCSNPGETYVMPICKYISRNEFLIDGPSHLGVFIKTSGISERPPINWGPNVSQIAYSYPYILCLKSNSISIISVIDQKVKDEFLFENGVHIDNFDGKIVVATKERLFSLYRISWQEQFNSLLLNEKSQEAVDLFHNLYETGMMTDQEFQQCESIKFRAGLIELKKQNFDLAKRFLFECHCEVERIFKLNQNLMEKLKIIATPEDDNVQLLMDKIIHELDTSIINRFLLDYMNDLISSTDYIDQVNFKLVKTAQLFLYFEDIECYSNSIKKFFDSQNDYYYELIEKYLNDKHYHYHMALYYASRGQMEKSIELLKKLEKKSIQDDHYPGLCELIRLLTECGNAQLIMNNVEFILEQDQHQGAQILIANTLVENDKFPVLNPEFVVRILHQHRQALIIYLEHLIDQMQLTNVQVHTTLIIIYIEILSLQQENEEQQSRLFEETREKLRQLLMKSDYYDQKIVLKNLIANNLDYEMATLYGKMGEHRKAFEIYLNDHHLDYNQAFKHCVYYGRRRQQPTSSLSPEDDRSQIYQQLLSIYLDLYRKNGPEVMKPLSEYLNHSECRFDLIKTLTVLPEDWPIKLIHRHLSNHLNRLFNSKFQSSFGHVLALSMAERQRQTKQRLINQSIRIDRNSVCFLCHTKLLDSKFVWIPSNRSIVHDFCYYGRILHHNDDVVTGNNNNNNNDAFDQ
ncbi:transforming growth factor-beta receptor-associated protein 1-like [Dermatophagoides farinae]|uniref:Transforming growth factor-beta receptor-associated protein 1-like n=1 Tax=Dermatophagoides farinae TaxID=6954 RepID=A0A9D4SFN9_DERFA|nr:transforming growth factor-beta receptor-associated protein 1-like [Dermatophagoides farinae]